MGYPRSATPNDAAVAAALTELPIVRLNSSSVANSLQAAVYPADEETEVCEKGAVSIGCQPAGKNIRKHRMVYKKHLIIDLGFPPLISRCCVQSVRFPPAQSESSRQHLICN